MNTELDEFGAATQGLAEWFHELGFPVPFAETLARACVELGQENWSEEN